MECKNCGELLEEGQTVCPACGENNENKRPKKKLSKKAKISIIAVSVVVAILLSIVGVGLCLIKPWQNDIYNKDKYLTSDFWANAARDQVVATMGEYELTNGRLQVFYWMQIYDLVNYYVEQYGEYAVYYLGIDLEKPLNEQIYKEETGMTWEQYFLEDAFYAWHRYQALADAAKQAGFKLPADYQKSFAEMEASMKKSAKEEGYESVDAMLQADLGSSVTFEDYYYYMDVYYTGNLYFSEVTSKLEFTDAELEEYYKKNEDSLLHYGITKDSGNLVDFRNILVKPVASKDDKGNTVYTEEAWKTCLEKAQTIMDTLQGTDLTEETFAALARIKSEDNYSSSNGGLYQYVAKNDLVTVDVRHILIMPQGGTKDANGKVTYSDAEWEACRIAAQALLDQYLAGEKTEAAFGALANEHSEDQDGKVTNGGLYEDVPKGQMVQPFEEWIFDGKRVSGETGLVKTQFGYHVMYFVERNDEVDAWIFDENRKVADTEMIKTDDGYQILYYVGDDVAWEVWCRDGLKTQTSEELMQSYADERPIDVRYWMIALSARPEAKK